MSKKLTTILLITLTVMLFSSCSKEKGCTDSEASNYSYSAEENDGSCIYPPKVYTLTVWSNFSGAPISVYIDGVYRGQITSIYQSAPSCWATGCVSVDFSTTGSFTITASDGTYNWNSSGTVSSTCNTYNLHL